MPQYLSLLRCLFVFIIYVSGISSSFAQWTECNGNYHLDRTKVTESQWFEFHMSNGGVTAPRLTINDFVFIYTNGSTCWPNGGYYYNGSGQVFSQGATAFCKSNSPPDIVSQCVPGAPPPVTEEIFK
jgi:hypothetical protein